MSQRVAEIIAREISAGGPIPFARFMELALYCPVYGYYEKEGDRIGRSGDFYTSVSVGRLFGDLLAFQFASWLRELVPEGVTSQSKDTRTLDLGHLAAVDGSLLIAEMGAHNGELARDILRGLEQTDPAVFAQVKYVFVEPSPGRTAWQQEKLSAFKDKVLWVNDVSGIAQLRAQAGHFGCQGIVFSNELLDAMPVHRLAWDASKQTWFEWGVTLRAGGFAWHRMDCTVPAPSLPPELLRVLPSGFVFESCPRAEALHRQAATLLARGWLVAIDYGLTEEELLIPERQSGTLRSYAGHHPGRDPLQVPGDQDLTAHVNFSAIERAGLSAGLKTIAFLSQERFLTGIASETLGKSSSFPPWTPHRSLELQTLTHPAHLGRAFRVLVQSREDRGLTASGSGMLQLVVHD